MLMKYCEKWGSTMPDDFVFCNKCSSKIKTNDYSVSNTGWGSAITEYKTSGVPLAYFGGIVHKDWL